MSRFRILSLILLLFPFASLKAADDDFLRLLRGEVDRQFALLQTKAKVYHLRFNVRDRYEVTIASSSGALTASKVDEDRSLIPSYRLGDPMSDYLIGLRLMSIPTPIRLPFEIDSASFASVIREGCNRFLVERIRSAPLKNQDIADLYAGELPVFTSAPVVNYEEAPDRKKLSPEEIAAWENRVKRISEQFLADTLFLQGRAQFSYEDLRFYCVASDGSAIVENRRYARLFFTGVVHSEEGSNPQLSKSYFAFSPDQLPPDSVIVNDVAEVMQTLRELREAEPADSYEGPAILSGQVAAVFFHEILGHRLESFRQRHKLASKTLTTRIGDTILPESFSIEDNPTIDTLNGVPLGGGYQFDEEGVRAERAELIKGGVLTGFLTTRAPLPGVGKSNGHARAEWGKMPASRQSNLIITCTNLCSDAELRDKLKREIVQQGKPFGYFVKQVSGGVTSEYVYSIDAFSVIPLLIYRVYPDNRPDELVRGVKLIGTPLTSLTGILAAGVSTGIFNGICGAESGRIPVSAISPSLLLERVELQRSSVKPDGFILPRP